MSRHRNQIVLVIAHPKRLHGSELMQAAAAFDAFDQIMLLSGRTAVDQIDRSLINSQDNRRLPIQREVCARDSADVPP